MLSCQPGNCSKKQEMTRRENCSKKQERNIVLMAVMALVIVQKTVDI